MGRFLLTPRVFLKTRRIHCAKGENSFKNNMLRQLSLSTLSYIGQCGPGLHAHFQEYRRSESSACTRSGVCNVRKIDRQAEPLPHLPQPRMSYRSGGGRSDHV